MSRSREGWLSANIEVLQEGDNSFIYKELLSEIRTQLGYDGIASIPLAKYSSTLLNMQQELNKSGTPIHKIGL